MARASQPYFIENKGQFHPNIQFLLEIDGMIVYFEKDGVKYVFYDRESYHEMMVHSHQPEKKHTKTHRIDYHVIKTTFDGGDTSRNIVGSSPANFYQNYFFGNDPQKWQHHVKLYEKITYQSIYPGIDIEYIISDNGLKYNFVIAPKADISSIKMKYSGHKSLKLDLLGKLDIGLSFTHLKESIPLSYHFSESGNPKPINCRYQLKDDVVSFKIENRQFKQDIRVIDPELVFSTYSGSSVDNFGFTATYDHDGSLYSGGISTSPYPTKPKGSYPTTLGAFSREYQGGTENSPANLPCDIAISKYSSDGSTLLYASLIGGVGNEFPHSLIVDSLGSLFIFGTTNSFDFPVDPFGYQTLKRSGSDMYVFKLSPDGSTMQGSTFIGGSGNDGLNSNSALWHFYADDFRGEINLDSDQNVYVGSCTKSDDFPTTPGAYSRTLSGPQSGVIFKLSSELRQLQWSTYFGGKSNDAIYGVEIKENRKIYIAGGTMSNDLPSTTNVATGKFNGLIDGFITLLSADGRSVEACRYYGTPQYEQIMSIELDEDENVYAVGHTQGVIEATENAYDAPNGKQFVTKFSADLDQLIFSSNFGSNRKQIDMTINAFMVDECKRMYISGWGGPDFSTGASTSGLFTTPDALQRNTDGSDFYLIVFLKDARDVLYATYFGGSQSGDHVDGGTSRFDRNAIIYQSVCSSCPDGIRSNGNELSDFPTTENAFSSRNKSPRCSNASFKIRFDLKNRSPRLSNLRINATALIESSFGFSALDPDYDSLWVNYDISNVDFINGESGSIMIDTGWYKTYRQIFVKPGCEDVGKTFKIPVYAYDLGCPLVADSAAMIEITVGPPPTPLPPEVLCLNFIDNDGVSITWENTPEHEFFSYMKLHKIDNNGDISVIKRMDSRANGVVQDFDVINPKYTNYAYYIVSYNPCDDAGDTSYLISTVKEFNTPIPSTYFRTATVVDNKNILVRWVPSDELDFGYYEVVRWNNGDANIDAEVVHTSYAQFDTSFVDQNVDVSKLSYCYAVIVYDNCGHVSLPSNKACTIVIKGEEHPFEFKLTWNPYESWPEGVYEYVLNRSVDTGIQRPIVYLDTFDLRYTDDNLDYCWGGYWYSVKAFENDNYNETSLSNSIYLIQPPLLHVPNAFTMNDDQLNDLWGIVPVFVKEYELNVYNRWGQKVYYSTDKKVLWNGLYQEERKRSEVFVYTITFTGWDRSTHHRKGTVTIVK
jgi:gliding motility-associated-like protein